MPECLPDFPRYVLQRDDGSWIGADDREGPWRPIPAPQSGMPWPAPPAAEDPSVAQPSPLSMAAQKVLNTMHRSYDHEPTRHALAAGVLRAAADQVVPDEGHTLPIHIPSPQWFRFDERKKTRAKILAIAAELEGTMPAPEGAAPWTDGPAVPESREPASVVADASPLSPDTRAVLAAIDGYDTPRITVAQAFRALAFLRPIETLAPAQLIRIAEELDP